MTMGMPSRLVARRLFGLEDGVVEEESTGLPVVVEVGSAVGAGDESDGLGGMVGDEVEGEGGGQAGARVPVAEDGAVGADGLRHGLPAPVAHHLDAVVADFGDLAEVAATRHVGLSEEDEAEHIGCVTWRSRWHVSRG